MSNIIRFEDIKKREREIRRRIEIRKKRDEVRGRLDKCVVALVKIVAEIALIARNLIWITLFYSPEPAKKEFPDDPTPLSVYQVECDAISKRRRIF